MQINLNIPVTEEKKSLVHGEGLKHHGSINIKAEIAIDKEDADLDFIHIKYNDGRHEVNILPMLDNIPAADELIQFFYDEVVEAAREKRIQSVRYQPEEADEQ
jgi:hypothetical protein